MACQISQKCCFRYQILQCHMCGIYQYYVTFSTHTLLVLYYLPLLPKLLFYDLVLAHITALQMKNHYVLRTMTTRARS